MTVWKFFPLYAPSPSAHSSSSSVQPDQNMPITVWPKKQATCFFCVFFLWHVVQLTDYAAPVVENIFKLPQVSEAKGGNSVQYIMYGLCGVFLVEVVFFVAHKKCAFTGYFQSSVIILWEHFKKWSPSQLKLSGHVKCENQLKTGCSQLPPEVHPQIKTSTHLHAMFAKQSFNGISIG